MKIVDATYKKPFLGGFKHKHTGVEYLNASSQTYPKKIIPKAVGCLFVYFSLHYSVLHAYTHVHMYMHKHICAHIHLHASGNVETHAYIRTYTCTYTFCVHIYSSSAKAYFLIML